MVCFNLFQRRYGLLDVLVRKCAVLPRRRSTYFFCAALVTLIYLAIQETETHSTQSQHDWEDAVANGTQFEMIRVNVSIQRLIEGSAAVVQQEHGRHGLAKTLLSDIGFRYVVRPVKQAGKRKLKMDPFLSNRHIYYAKKVACHHTAV